MYGESNVIGTLSSVPCKEVFNHVSLSRRLESFIGGYNVLQTVH